MSLNPPKVSVVLPTHNRAHLVGRSIRTVLSQSFRDLELLVVDDGSTDGTAAVVQGFADKDARVRYLPQPTNRGAAAARNVGVREARGEWIAFHDSDDEWPDGKLEAQMAAHAADPEAAFSYGDLERVDRAGRRTVARSPTLEPGALIGRSGLDYAAYGIWMPTFVVRRSLFDQAGLFDEDLGRLIDLDLVIRLNLHGRGLNIPPRPGHRARP